MTEYLVPLAAALLPTVLLLVYIIKKDPQPEPANWLWRGVLYGVLICLPVALTELAIQMLLFGGNEATTVVGAVADAFLVAALPEEGVKLLALWLLLRKNPWFDEHFDGIVYAVCISLGFAGVENVLYIVADEDWQTVAVSRALLSVPGHYAFAVLMGYYYSVYHFLDRSPRAAAMVLAAPVAAHGIYDALALSTAVNMAFSALCFLALIVFCIRMHKFAHRKVVAQVERDRAKNTWNETAQTLDYTV